MIYEPRGIAALLGQNPAQRRLYMGASARASREAGTELGRRRVVLASLLVLAGTLLGLRDAAAHSRLVKSDPTARAVLPATPKEVKLWFNEPVEPAFAKIWIAPAAGENIYLPNHGDPTDKKLLVATFPEALEDGPIVLAFRVLSVDGHVIESELKFTIKHPA